MKTGNTRPYLMLLPVLGILCFILLYVVATAYYPGGSQFDKQAPGFSWFHNYWCNLLSDDAINGQQNPAQPVALAAMFILCFSLICFWWQFPACISLNKIIKWSIRVCGVLAMICSLFLFTKFNHDQVINLASLFGLLATIGTLAGLFKNGWKILFCFGLLNLILVGANNFLYYNKVLIFYLPLVQKITFAAFLFWISAISIKLWRTLKKTG